MRLLSEIDKELHDLAIRASELLGEQAVLFDLSYLMELKVETHGRRDAPVCLATAAPVTLHYGPAKNDEIFWGTQIHRLALPDGELRLVYFSIPDAASLPSIWGVAQRDYERLRKLIEQWHVEAMVQTPPILTESDKSRLLANTIEYLQRDDHLMKRYCVPKKRGVLLRGEPGNGKTMACRWLRSLCLKQELEFKTVTVDNYSAARQNHSTSELFQTDLPGIILFDDFDQALRDRTKFGDEIQSMFLAELDGMSPKEGVVYMFTSNLSLNEIDPAAQRPGRIDAVFEFLPPGETLRRQFVHEQWPAEVVELIGEELLVESTAGWSFAELEEVRKLTVLRWLDGQDVRWKVVRAALVERRESAKRSTRPMGFAVVHTTVENTPLGPLAQE